MHVAKEINNVVLVATFHTRCAFGLRWALLYVTLHQQVTKPQNGTCVELLQSFYLL